MGEASKTRTLWGPREWGWLNGQGIDIGCGTDPITPMCDRFDHHDGDANRISEFVTKKYDFVFSSHTLEHMDDPYEALREWFRLLKPGGVMVIVVPDEDRYEQGCCPSVFNSDHKWTFTIAKKKSWSPRSTSLLGLVKSLGADLVSVELQSVQIPDDVAATVRRRITPVSGAHLKRRLGRITEKLARRAPGLENAMISAAAKLGALIDYTNLRSQRLAQIQLVIRAAPPVEN